MQRVKIRRATKPVFSWERPIEDIILDYTDRMASRMEELADAHRETGWFANNELSDGCRHMAKAYRTVQHFIEREIRLRGTFETETEANES